MRSLLEEALGAVEETNANHSQDEPLLPDFAILLALPHHRLVLRRCLVIHRFPGDVHSYWKLHFLPHGMDRSGFPDHRYLSHDVSFPNSPPESHIH